MMQLVSPQPELSSSEGHRALQAQEQPGDGAGRGSKGWRHGRDVRKQDSGTVIPTLCLLVFAVLVPSPPALLVSAGADQHHPGMQVCASL